MNILLTTSAAPVKSPFSTCEKRPPMGLGSIYSVLRQQKHKIHFIDNYLTPTTFIQDGFLQTEKIDIVGIYANTICFADTLKMLNSIQQLREKKLWKGKIVLGGPHTSASLSTIPEFVDFVVVGEGERAILEIINGDHNERVIYSERISDLDSLPFQPWDIFNALPYDFSCQWFDDYPVYTMNTSRGCPFACTFCSVNSIWKKQYSFFSADRIIAEIEFLIKRHNARGIYFREDNFTLNTDRTISFCEKLITRGINIKWACESRVNNLNHDLIKLMADAGCRALYLGIESGSQKMLDSLKKNITVDQIRNVVNWAKNCGIHTYCSLITGLPEETIDDYKLTMKLLRELKPHSYSFNIFVGIPGSPLYRKILDNNYYEYKDENELLYPPGFDIKTKFFYRRSSRELVDFNFRKRTNFDKFLQKQILIDTLQSRLKSAAAYILPVRIYNCLKNLKNYLRK